MTSAAVLVATRNTILLARGSTLLRARTRIVDARTRRGLELLRKWMSLYWSWWGEFRPKRIARDLGLPNKAATDIGYALSSLARRGYVLKIGSHPARYIITPLFAIVLENHGCLERRECDSGTACGLIGTWECPFLVGYGGDSSDSDG